MVFFKLNIISDNRPTLQLISPKARGSKKKSFMTQTPQKQDESKNEEEKKTFKQV